ncbi:uncharacterized protein LOC116296560 [Actinia tenebrosa]|uniref:Uncharacterized protein LOC116296560 n=1 Tax=Actinia tenebrosa TaxID=6105 RepID=A0A6P8I6V1_ACTTE|nr:uncharacterized protein LOC116296560 [Actinia tenebrosa]
MYCTTISRNSARPAKSYMFTDRSEVDRLLRPQSALTISFLLQTFDNISEPSEEYCFTANSKWIENQNKSKPFSCPSRSYSSYSLEQSNLNCRTTIETKIKKDTVFLAQSPCPSNLVEESSNFTVAPEKFKEDIPSEFGATRSTFREPIEQKIIVKSERDSFESDCAVGSHKATNETPISSEIFTENFSQLTDSIISNKDINFVSVKTEDTQEDKLFPSSGSCFDDSQPDQDMADPFFEEFMDFSNLFPELIPGVDADACTLLPEILMPKEEPQTIAIKDLMADLDSILAETALASNDNQEDEVLNIEVVEEAPTPVMQDPTEVHSVLSPGSVLSVESCDTSNYTSTYAESTSSDNIDVDLLQILELLEKDQTHTGEPVPEGSTVDAGEIFPETVTSIKCKNPATEEPAAKRAKPQQIANHTSSDKATQRRIKNNAASRVCRATRRQREEELFQKEKELIESNAALKAQLEELTKETQTLRSILVQRLSSCN